ncbi:MAG: argininosuccinate lyase [Syntrophobacterales bacterium]
MRDKPWGGRFEGVTEKAVEEFSSSLHFDRRLYRHDIRGSMAHARMLAKQGILSVDEAEAIIQGLAEIQQEIEAGEFPFDPALEDIHMAIEARLTAKIGETGRKLHTARSRNDQVALDVRLYLSEEVEALLEALTELRRAGAHLARRYIGVILPGYTHLQRAQPVLFAHHLLAYDDMWRRDQMRLAESLARIRVSPLGAAALAGTTFPIDPAFSAGQLGFPEVFRNSLDAAHPGEVRPGGGASDESADDRQRPAPGLQPGPPRGQGALIRLPGHGQGLGQPHGRNAGLPDSPGRPHSPGPTGGFPVGHGFG